MNPIPALVDVCQGVEAAMKAEAMEEVVVVLEEEAEAMVDMGAMEEVVLATIRRRRWTKLLALRYGVLILLLL